jgi:hypothetical protein
MEVYLSNKILLTNTAEHNSGFAEREFLQIDKFFRKKFYLSRKLYGYEVRNFCKPPNVNALYDEKTANNNIISIIFFFTNCFKEGLNLKKM